MSRLEVYQGLDRPGVSIPCDPEAGVEAEVDWGTATVIIGGECGWGHPLKGPCQENKAPHSRKNVTIQVGQKTAITTVPYDGATLLFRCALYSES